MDQGRSFYLKGKKDIRLPQKNRIILGASDSCDVRMRGAGIDDIHCLIEFADKVSIYSMSSLKPVLVNGEEIVTTELRGGETITIGNYSFTFDSTAQLPPQQLIHPQEVVKNLPKQPKFNDERIRKDEEYQVNYPLSIDDNVKFSEYIFEEPDEIYPIFKYSIDKEAAEVIILFNGKIVSLDYVPHKDGKFYLVGSNASGNDIEFPYLGKKEKVELLDIRKNDVAVGTIPGFKHRTFLNNKNAKSSLRRDDIHIFEKDNLKVFIRGTEAPPIVKTAPIFRRDKELRKYLVFCLLFFIVFAAGMLNFKVDKEIEKEKVPERIAKILYRPKQLRVTKKKNVVKNEVKKKVEKKAPVKQAVSNVEKPRKVTKSKGDPRQKSTSTPKKGKARQGKPNDKQVVRQKKKKASKPARTTNKKTTVKKLATNRKSRGKVDVYKSTSFTSSMNSLMAKGGALNSFKAGSGASESFADDNSALSTGDSAQVQKADVKAEVGSLSSKASGKLSSSFGTDGLVQKKQVYIAGVPYREVILGSMDRNDIMRILMENVPQFRYCYQKELDVQQKGISGVLGMEFVIGASGNVTKASVAKADRGVPPSVKNCVVNHLKTIQFPRPKGGAEVGVHVPLNLNSSAY
ncbi:FHA domain protein [Bacteriovorax sp. BAL6_X]|uniref:AgmX/PglI C-terminal domain-containing protein n=1 Tax=Bacteriovorax sp. BAL6_X TaxID=1201290 RepID=UPI00038641E1|nr:AgmX/PglI C-terminal domain-containing protein [Bacteriovorax sp. BAL6_X]EPZ50103.1 FHA domain protein [Bacteriovorax sp. BAL6_X]